jgi:hypothetical protein
MNRIYLGEIVHKDRHYRGQHAAILDEGLWDQVQAHLAINAGDRRAGRAAKQPSLLTRAPVKIASTTVAITMISSCRPWTISPDHPRKSPTNEGRGYREWRIFRVCPDRVAGHYLLDK